MGDVAAALTWPLTRPLTTQPGGPVFEPSMRIRRVLFGPADHEKVKLSMIEDFKKIYEEDRQRWNFDFENDRPLAPGRYSWEKVGDPSDADSNGGSVTQENKQKSVKKREQTQLTDFMRKRKSSSNQKDSPTQRPKTRRRSST